MADFAVIETGAKQYVVAPGTKIKIEKIAGNAGDSVSFDKVLVAGDKIGAPYVNGVAVKGTILRQARDKKKIIFKYHSKNRFDRKKGHRQHFTEVQIESL